LTHPDQCRQLTAEDGVRELGPAPISSVTPGRPPDGRDQQTVGRHLWVIDERGIPFIEERVEAALRLHDGVAKHTNLTGCGDAHCGGELWFREATTRLVWVSGGSGRYPPRSPTELADARSVIEAHGYEATSLGWDDETGTPARVLREHE
jgi:hypothetical protein